MLLHQVCDDLGVGLGRELVALFDELLLQGKVVLNDAVVHDDDPSGAIAVRVSVLLRRTTMCGPPGMPYAIRALERLLPDSLFQVPQLAFRPTDVHSLTVDHGNTGRIVATIFQTTQAIDDHRNN